jgi:hypothetical protein
MAGNKTSSMPRGYRRVTDKKEEKRIVLFSFFYQMIIPKERVLTLCWCRGESDYQQLYYLNWQILNIESKGEIFILAFSNNPPPLQRSLLTRYVNTQSFPRKEILPIAKVPPTIYSPRFAHVSISLSSQVWAVNSRYSSNYARLDLNRRRHFRFTRLWHVRHFQSEYAT